MMTEFQSMLNFMQVNETKINIATLIMACILLISVLIANVFKK